MGVKVVLFVRKGKDFVQCRNVDLDEDNKLDLTNVKYEGVRWRLLKVENLSRLWNEGEIIGHQVRYYEFRRNVIET